MNPDGLGDVQCLSVHGPFRPRGSLILSSLPSLSVEYLVTFSREAPIPGALSSSPLAFCCWKPGNRCSLLSGSMAFSLFLCFLLKPKKMFYWQRYGEYPASSRCLVCMYKYPFPMFLSGASSIICLVGEEIQNTSHSSPNFLKKAKKNSVLIPWMKIGRSEH